MHYITSSRASNMQSIAPMLDAALSLQAAGYAVLWVRRGGKAPIAREWQEAPIADEATLRRSYRRGYNLGVRCGHWSQPAPGHGLVILDLDIKDAAAEPEAIAAT